MADEPEKLKRSKGGKGLLVADLRTERADNIYVIDLRKVRKRFGAEWASLQEGIHVIVQKIIEKYLVEKDYFIRHDDKSYILAFPALSKEQAQLKCIHIGEEIVDTLIGRQLRFEYFDIKGLSVLDDGEIKVVEPVRVHKLIESLARNFEHFSGEVPAMAKPGGQTLLEYAVTLGLDDVGFVFLPMVGMRKKITSTFLCVPVRALKGIHVSGYDVLLDSSDPKHIFGIDMLTLRKGASELEALRKEEARSLLALPVHFETLADVQRRDSYLDYLAATFTGQKRRVVLEVVGLPEGIPQTRLFELLTQLRPHTRAIMARFSLDHTYFEDFRTAGLHAVGVDVYSPRRSEATVMKKLDAFVANAKKCQLKAYVHGVRTISLYTAAISSGFDYIAGHALNSAVRSAEDIHAFRMVAPYLDLRKSLAVLDTGKGATRGGHGKRKSAG